MVVFYTFSDRGREAVLKLYKPVLFALGHPIINRLILLI